MARVRGTIRGGGSEWDVADDDKLPWLEPADDDEAEATLISRRSLLFGIGGLAVALVAVVWFLYAQVAVSNSAGSDTGSDVEVAAGAVPLIKAPDGPYKVRPANPGGMDVDGVDQTTFAAAEGVVPGGQIALDALPEEAVARPAAAEPVAPPPVAESAAAPAASKPVPAKPKQVSTQPRPAATPKPAAPTEQIVKMKPPVAVKPEPVKPIPAPAPADDEAAGGPGGLALQLGAFSSKAKANEAWKNFSSRYSYLSNLEKAVEPLKRDDKTLYRLRAVGLASRAQAEDLCGRLKVAGEHCLIAD